MRKNKTIYLTPLGLVGITILTGAFLVSSNSFATDNTDVVDEINLTVPLSCSLEGTGMTSHNANIVNGTYQADIGSTTLKVFCNDTNGFAIYAIGYTDNEYGKTVLTNSTLGTSADIATGTATSGNTSNWAMKLATNSSATYPITIDNSFDNYHAVPSPYAKVAHRDSGTDIGTNATGAELTSTYAAYMNQTQPAGTYTGQVKYTLVHPSDAEAPLSPQPATAGCINYFANASTAVGTMGCQSATDGNTITLLASNFSRTGYGFAGWSDKYDYATNPNAHFYGPQEDITVPTGTITNGLSLYAVWIKSEGSIQDTDKVASLCGTNGVGGSLTTAPTDGTANLSSVSALTDQRDNETYAIARLADGNCWMIENLRLEAENTRTPEKQALAQGYGTSSTYGNFGGLADAESSGFTSTYTANSLYYSGTQSGTASINIGTSSPGYRMPRYNNINTLSRASNPTDNLGDRYSYGNYYTWHAAIADTTYYNSGNHDTTSLCPFGWHLPKGGDKINEANNEFWSLVVDGVNNGTKPANYDNQTRSYYTATPEGNDVSSKLREYPNNFLYSGYFVMGSAFYTGSIGAYSSSTVFQDVTRNYILILESSDVYPGTGFTNRYNGICIRCTVGS